MNRVRLCSLPGLPTLRRLALGACAAGLPVAAWGCTGPGGLLSDRLVGPQVVLVEPACGRSPACPACASRVAPAAAPAPAQGPIRQVQATTVDAPAPPPVAAKTVKQLPITLDTVLRLAEDQNRQIALARERLNEACAEKNLAALSWIPNLYFGTSYYRHEGGIQGVSGRFFDSSFGALFNGVELGGRFDVREATFLKIVAERRVLQQRGELSKVTSETLLEAANTYIDMLLARSSAAVAREMEKYHAELLERTEKIYGKGEREPGILFQLEALRSEMHGRHQAIAKVEQQAGAAATKLAYLLGLDECVELVPLDVKLVPFDLVNADQPACQLVNLALTQGPGIAELQRLMAVIQNGIERMRGPVALMPILELRAAEGGFGAGPGAALTWDNRLDINLQLRWNLTGLIGAQERQRVAQSKLGQVHLTYQDLRGKLTAGVREAHDSIRGGREQMALGADQIQHAQKAYEASHKRLTLGVPGSSITEVQQILRLLELARLTQLAVISSYDKAQLRLLVLLGPAYGTHPATRAPTGECPLPTPADR